MIILILTVCRTGSTLLCNLINSQQATPVFNNECGIENLLRQLDLLRKSFEAIEQQYATCLALPRVEPTHPHYNAFSQETAHNLHSVMRDALGSVLRSFFAVDEDARFHGGKCVHTPSDVDLEQLLLALPEVHVIILTRDATEIQESSSRANLPSGHAHLERLQALARALGPQRATVLDYKDLVFPPCDAFRSLIGEPFDEAAYRRTLATLCSFAQSERVQRAVEARANDL